MEDAFEGPAFTFNNERRQMMPSIPFLLRRTGYENFEDAKFAKNGQAISCTQKISLTPSKDAKSNVHLWK